MRAFVASSLPRMHVRSGRPHSCSPVSTATAPSACLRRAQLRPMTTSTLPPPFGAFFTAYFQRSFPTLGQRLRPGRAAFAATAYLFRYDTRLSVDFISRNVDALASAIADASGKSIAEARRLFTLAVTDAAIHYFSSGWNDVSVFVTTNSPQLTQVHSQSTRLAAITEKLASQPAAPVDSVLLHRLLEQRLPVMVMVYADYCSVCKQIRPLFEMASESMRGRMFFVRLNGPQSPDIKGSYHITSYPSILRFDTTSRVTTFPKARLDMSTENIVEFAQGDAAEASDSEDEELDIDYAALNTRRSGFDWESILKLQGIDELDDLANEREQRLHPRIEESCGEVSCKIPTARARTAKDPPPLCVLLGGGMGAGKTTVVGLVAKTRFWREFGTDVVIVEADAFKLNDPLFQVLRGVTPLASRIVHQDSIAAAEELFLQAVNSRRDVLFDGTLSWSEYARQTIKMLRDTEFYWERGPGYSKDEDGAVVEEYWRRGKTREEPAPAYNVELVGVTAQTEISVMRGIVRRITSGRGVGVTDQLKSHAMFSSNFEEYVDMVHAAYLFDTTMNDCRAEGGADDYESQMIAIKDGVLFQNPDGGRHVDEGEGGEEGKHTKLVVRNAEAYKRFLRKKHINLTANGSRELYDADFNRHVSLLSYSDI